MPWLAYAGQGGDQKRSSTISSLLAQSALACSGSTAHGLTPGLTGSYLRHPAVLAVATCSNRPRDTYQNESEVPINKPIWVK
jgi:hypothetical protein